jgi:hypothetical protein
MLRADVGADVGGGAIAVGGEQPDLVGREPRLVAATPEALVGDDLGPGAGQEVGEQGPGLETSSSLSSKSLRTRPTFSLSLT